MSSTQMMNHLVRSAALVTPMRIRQVGREPPRIVFEGPPTRQPTTQRLEGIRLLVQAGTIAAGPCVSRLPARLDWRLGSAAMSDSGSASPDPALRLEALHKIRAVEPASANPFPDAPAPRPRVPLPPSRRGKPGPRLVEPDQARALAAPRRRSTRAPPEIMRAYGGAQTDGPVPDGRIPPTVEEPLPSEPPAASGGAWRLLPAVRSRDRLRLPGRSDHARPHEPRRPRGESAGCAPSRAGQHTKGRPDADELFVDDAVLLPGRRPDLRGPGRDRHYSERDAQRAPKPIDLHVRRRRSREGGLPSAIVRDHRTSTRSPSAQPVDLLDRGYCPASRSKAHPPHLVSCRRAYVFALLASRQSK